jgi:hypothetical protein
LACFRRITSQQTYARTIIILENQAATPQLSCHQGQSVIIDTTASQ